MKKQEAFYLPGRREKLDKLSLNQQQPKDFQSPITYFALVSFMEYLIQGSHSLKAG